MTKTCGDCVCSAPARNAKAAGPGSVRVGTARTGLWTPEHGAAPQQRAAGAS